MSYENRRRLMVEQQLKPRGITDERVLHAMETVPRHLFVDPGVREIAYEDCAHPIGEGQTISQPYMVAVMTQLLELQGNEKVLEIGTGSGYQTAVLSMLAAEVYSVERIAALSEKAGRLLRELHYDNAHVIVSDGTLGLPGEAPFDGIIVTAGAPEIPDAYVEQLRDGGRLVIPVGGRYSQRLYQMKKTPSGVMKTLSTSCVFVPLIGERGWQDSESY